MVSPIPIAISAISLGFLHSTGKVLAIADGFFSHLTILEQICIASLFFSVIHIVVSISRFLGIVYDGPGGDHGGGHSHHDEDIYAAYPFESMQLAANKRYRFGAMFPTLVDEIVTHLQEEGEGMELKRIEQIQEAMEPISTTEYDKCGMVVVEVYRIMIKARMKRDLAFLEEAKATVLGWAMIILFYSHDVLANSARDSSKVRYAILMESYVFFILHKHFHDDKCYHQLLELFLEAKENMALHHLMRSNANASKIFSLGISPSSDNAEDILLNRFNRMKEHFCVLYMPVAMCMILLGVKDAVLLETAKQICDSLGEATHEEEWKSDAITQSAMKSLGMVPIDAFQLIFDEKQNNCLCGDNEK